MKNGVLRFEEPERNTPFLKSGNRESAGQAVHLAGLTRH